MGDLGLILKESCGLNIPKGLVWQSWKVLWTCKRWCLRGPHGIVGATSKACRVFPVGLLACDPCPCCRVPSLEAGVVGFGILNGNCCSISYMCVFSLQVNYLSYFVI